MVFLAKLEVVKLHGCPDGGKEMSKRTWIMTKPRLGLRSWKLQVGSGFVPIASRVETMEREMPWTIIVVI